MESIKIADRPIRERNFCLVTYACKDCIADILSKHACKANYIYHDKDEDVTPHFHIVLRLKNATTGTAVKSWFVDAFDENGELGVNTFVEYCTNVTSSLRYLIHLDSPDEFSYSPDEVLSFGDGAINDFYTAISNNNPELDSATRAVLFLIDGGTVRDCALKFGRDFIYHYRQIKDILTDWECTWCRPVVNGGAENEK